MAKLRKRLKSRRQRVYAADFVVGMNSGFYQGYIVQSTYGAPWGDKRTETLTWDIQFMYMYLVEEEDAYGPRPNPYTLGDFNEEIQRQNKVKQNKFLDYLNGFDKPEYYYGR
ncbi:MAG: hypothetical protein JWO15_3582 [Sphingomonadales bacterium]|nr:hypothetical protein [Sphingomonadales bacterium]